MPRMNAPRSHQPKGGQCMTCERRTDDCSALPFERMPKIEMIEGGVVVVRCTAHARTPAAKERP